MIRGRAFPLVLMLAVLPVGPAAAQQPLPPACQQIRTDRDEVAKHNQVLRAALLAAISKRLSSEEVCQRFKEYLAAEAKMIKGLEENRDVCRVSAEVIDLVKTGHAKGVQRVERQCEAAFASRAPQCMDNRRVAVGRCTP
jgi:hypothetical protein